MDNFDLDKDLEALWRGSDEKGKQLLANIDLKNAVRRKSKGIDFKIFRNMAMEIVIGFAFSIYVCFLIESTIILWLFIGFSALVLSFSILFFLQIWQKFKALNNLSILANLAKRIQIFQLYLRATRLVCYAFIPVGFYLGLIIGYQEGVEMTGLEVLFEPLLWITALALTPLLLLLVWLFERKYLYWFYGCYLDEYKKIQAELEAEN